MTSGTKIILAVITLFVGILVVYYGFVMPGGDETAGVTDGASSSSASTSAGAAAPDAKETPQAPESKRDVAPGRSRSTKSDPAPAGNTLRDPERRTPVTGRAEEPAPVLARDTSRLPATGSPPGGGTELASAAPDGAAPGSAAMKPAGAPDLSTPPAPTGGSFGTPINDQTALGGAAARSADPRTATATAPPAVAAGDGRETTLPLRTTPPPASPRETRTPPAYTIYTVAEGDTLTSIAERWFGDHRKWDLIAKANPVDPNRLQIGQSLRLPPKNATPEPVTRPTEAQRVTYTVRSGDTLSSIAEAHYGEAALWAHVYAVNRALIGTDADTLSVGMKLVIPAAPAKRP